MNTVIIILGPTASNKSAVAIELAKQINGEIICADSKQIYQHFNIGTSKPTKEQMQQVPHHLYDIVDPAAEFSVFEYKKLAYQKIDELLNNGKVPILVGGSGLYIKSIIDDLSFAGVKPKRDVRESLLRQAEKYGNEYLYNRLKIVDPLYAEKISENDIKRIIRGLEVYLSTGKPFSHFFKTKPKSFKYNTIIIGLDYEREKLYKRINRRVDRLIERGWINEVKELLEKYDRNINAFTAIGYREIIDYLDNKQIFKETVNLIKKQTRNYAKRQLTYFKNEIENINWVKADREINEVVEDIKEIITPAMEQE